RSRLTVLRTKGMEAAVSTERIVMTMMISSSVKPDEFGVRSSGFRVRLRLVLLRNKFISSKFYLPESARLLPTNLKQATALRSQEQAKISEPQSARTGTSTG